MKERGFVKENGMLNNNGYQYMTKRFNVNRKDIDDALKALTRNGEYIMRAT